MILHCAIVQTEIDRDRHDCRECPAVQAITVALKDAGLQGLLPVAMSFDFVQFRAEPPRLSEGPGAVLPDEVVRWVDEFDDYKEPPPIAFDLELPESVVRQGCKLVLFDHVQNDRWVHQQFWMNATSVGDLGDRLRALPRVSFDALFVGAVAA